MAYHRGLYHDLYQLLENHCFTSKFHTELQVLWYKAHYKEAEKVRGRTLGKLMLSRIVRLVWPGNDPMRSAICMISICVRNAHVNQSHNFL